MIDGDANPYGLISMLKDKNLTLLYILLTHEHFDHCQGLDEIRRITGVKLGCTTSCSRLMGCSKTNLTAYYPGVEPFAMEPADFVMEGARMILPLPGGDAELLYAPGHSPGGMCIRMGRAWFTGDTLLTEGTVPCHLPGGNRTLLSQTHRMLRTHMRPDDMIYPGHGRPAMFAECERWMAPEERKPPLENTRIS